MSGTGGGVTPLFPRSTRLGRDTAFKGKDMCDAALKMLAQWVEAGFRPHTLMFSEVDCGGHVFPEKQTDVQFNVDYTRENTPQWPSWTVRSVIVPSEQYLTVVARASTNPGYLALPGPRTIPNLANDITLVQLWQPRPGTTCQGTGLPNQCGTAVSFDFTNWDAVQFKMLNPWDDQVLASCNNLVPLKVGSHVISRYEPRSETCDTFMTKQCSEHPNSTGCACFLEQKALDPTLPVKCFGVECQKGKGYLTNAMNNTNCNYKNCNKFAVKAGLDSGTEVQCGGQLVTVQGGSTSLTFLAWAIPLGILIIVGAVLLWTLWSKHHASMKKLPS